MSEPTAAAALDSFDAADEHYAVPHHVDDFCSSDNRCESALRTHCELFEDAMRAAFDCTSQLAKAKPWAAICTMLGVTIDTVTGTISLSEERMARILELLAEHGMGQTMLTVPRESDIPPALTQLTRWTITRGIMCTDGVVQRGAA